MKKSASRARGSRFVVVVDRVVDEEPPIVEVIDEITIISVVAAKPKLVLKDCYVPLV